KVATDETVGELKTVIKSENKNLFGDVDARVLVLWQASIPSGDDEEERSINLKNHTDAKKLKATSEISGVFGPASAKKTTHVIVRRPAAAP
ncbi:hypothetical protein BGX21_006850, partial [Mortierella sp. AD011]